MLERILVKQQTGPEERKLRGKWKGTEPDKDDIIDLLVSHKEWLESNEVKGERADFSGAQLSEIDLSSRRLDKAIFSCSDLSNANLEGASLHGAIFSGAILEGANFSYSILTEADFRGANLFFTNFTEAKLQHADLRSRSWLGRQLAKELNKEYQQRTWIEAANLSNADVYLVRYNRWAKYHGLNISTAFGSARFKRFAQDQDFIEEFRSRPQPSGAYPDTKVPVDYSWLFRATTYLFWSIFSDCGRSLMLWALWSIIIALSFAFVYTPKGNHAVWPVAKYSTLCNYVWSSFDGIVNSGRAKTEGIFLINNVPDVGITKLETRVTSLRNSIYFSVVTFTTLGFGDVVAGNMPTRLVVLFEVIIGYLMLGGLVSILATKLARRS